MAIVAALIGLALATGLIGYVGFGKVAGAFAEIGFRGLLGLIAAYLPPVGLLAAAWLVLDPGAPPRTWFTLYFARLVRDASGELLPFSSLGGRWRSRPRWSMSPPSSSANSDSRR